MMHLELTAHSVRTDELQSLFGDDYVLQGLDRQPDVRGLDVIVVEVLQNVGIPVGLYLIEKAIDYILDKHTRKQEEQLNPSTPVNFHVTITINNAVYIEKEYSDIDAFKQEMLTVPNTAEEDVKVKVLVHDQ